MTLGIYPSHIISTSKSQTHRQSALSHLSYLQLVLFLCLRRIIADVPFGAQTIPQDIIASHPKWPGPRSHKMRPSYFPMRGVSPGWLTEDDRLGMPPRNHNTRRANRLSRSRHLRIKARATPIGLKYLPWKVRVPLLSHPYHPLSRWATLE